MLTLQRKFNLLKFDLNNDGQSRIKHDIIKIYSSTYNKQHSSTENNLATSTFILCIYYLIQK